MESAILTNYEMNGRRSIRASAAPLGGVALTGRLITYTLLHVDYFPWCQQLPVMLPRLIFVTGKGGTGKSTVAAALAVALARTYPATLADLDQRLSAARILGVELGGAATVRVDDELEVAALTPRAELEAFIERIVPLKAVSRRMLRSHTFGYVTSALPGLEAFLMLERLRLMAGRAALENRYAVIDGPASGNALELLSAARAAGDLAPIGSLNRLAAAVDEFLRAPQRFGAMLTVWPEELALREAIETAVTLRDRLGVRCVAAALNGVADALFTPAEIAKIRELGDHARMAERRREAADFASHARRELGRAGIMVIELPMIFCDTLGRAELETLADLLAAGLHEE
jgi:hypothetical protein